jgi:hypothetical protein
MKEFAPDASSGECEAFTEMNQMGEPPWKKKCPNFVTEAGAFFGREKEKLSE